MRWLCERAVHFMDTEEVLDQFFGAYFHQDWVDEHASADEVVRLFVRDMDKAPERVRETADAIDQLVASSPDEESLRTALDRYGCYYLPGADGLTYREWLRHVVSILGHA